MSAQIVIGLYDEHGKPIGYKADSFWSLTRSVERAKPHRLKDGKIEEHLIWNFKSVLKSPGDKVAGQIPRLINTVQKAAREDYHERFETRLIGWEPDGGGEVTFTHRVFEDDVQELTEEDLAMVAARLKEGMNV